MSDKLAFQNLGKVANLPAGWSCGLWEITRRHDRKMGFSAERMGLAVGHRMRYDGAARCDGAVVGFGRGGRCGWPD